MDAKQKHAQAGKEEEKGNVKERWQRLDRPRKMQPVDALGEE